MFPAPRLHRPPCEPGATGHGAGHRKQRIRKASQLPGQGRGGGKQTASHRQGSEGVARTSHFQVVEVRQAHIELTPKVACRRHWGTLHWPSAATVTSSSCVESTASTR